MCARDARPDCLADERPAPREERDVRALDGAWIDREPPDRRPPLAADRELPFAWELPFPRELAARRPLDPVEAWARPPELLRRPELDAPALLRPEALELRRPDPPALLAVDPLRDELARRPAPARPRSGLFRRCFSCSVSG